MKLQQSQTLTAESLLALIERHLPELWQAHAHSGNRSLRTVLRKAETLIAARSVAPHTGEHEQRREEQ